MKDYTSTWTAMPQALRLPCFLQQIKSGMEGVDEQ